MKTIKTGETEAAKTFQQIVLKNMLVRVALGRVTQRDLAKALCVTQATVSLKLNGRQDWTADDVANAAAFFGCSFADLVSDEAVRGLEPRQGATIPADLRYLVQPVDEDGGKRKSPGRGGMERVHPGTSAPRGIRTHNPRLKRTLL